MSWYKRLIIPSAALAAGTGLGVLMGQDPPEALATGLGALAGGELGGMIGEGMGKDT